MPTTTYNPQDARLVASSATSNFGASVTSGTIIGLATSLLVWRIPLDSPLSGDAIPAGAIIDSVTINTTAITLGGQGDGGSGSTWTGTMRRLSRTNWVEGTDTGTIVPATSGATWNQFDASLGSPAGDWTSAGGDFTGKEWTFACSTGTGAKTLAPTNAGDFVEIFQGGLDDHAGIVSIGIYRATSGSGQQWGTKDNTTAGNRPLITVEWHMPEEGPSTPQKAAALAARGRGRVRCRM